MAVIPENIMSILTPVRLDASAMEPVASFQGKHS